jgi:putative glutamine amidotransferase
MKPPLIGFSTYRERAAWGVWQQQADLLPQQYAAAVEALGALAVLLPPNGLPAAAETIVSRLDALVISGGADINPQRYGESPHSQTSQWRDDRDTWEFALLDAALSEALPVLGVCRGMQVMAVHGGGSLEQHTPDLVGHDEHSPGGDVFGQVEVNTMPGSRLAELVGDRLTVNCHHHQGVRTYPGYTAAAFATDGTIEAFEAAGDRFCMGVQWHPETMLDVGLLAGLVKAASQC